MSEVYNDYNNNFGWYIPKVMQEEYVNWMINNPEIVQLDENLNVIKVWPNKLEIAKYFNSRIQGVDLALRNSCRFKGYHFVIKVLYDRGLRPIVKEKRNTAIYAYNPPQEIFKRIFQGEKFVVEDFYKEPWNTQFQLITRYKNSVAAGNALDLSVTNIRRVAKNDNILFHKEYFFSFDPILPIHKVVADICDLLEKQKQKIIKEDEEDFLNKQIEIFKKTYTEEGRVIGYVEKSIRDILLKKNE